MLLDFGQPLDGITQVAYVVADLDRSMSEFTRQLGVGPWFVRGPFRPPQGRHRGEPTQMSVSLARGFSGHLMVELVIQHDEGRSVYHEEDGPRRYGFHHWAKLTRDLDGELARHREEGHEEAFFDQLASGARVVYVDTTPDLPGMIELVECTPAQERAYAAIYAAAIGWDGSDPVRREG
ncbi:MAG: VOC family protein [Solirubrobacterales bacterium]